MYFPTYDGSTKCTTRAWVEKLDTYFQLNRMMEMEAIKMATLHLEGEAHDWWFISLSTLGHDCVISYEDFTRRVVEHFDRRDLEAHFRELSQLRQTGHPEHYILRFLRVSIMVPDLFDARRVHIYRGLQDPLRGLVKSHRPSTLQEAVTCARDLQGEIPKTRALIASRTPYPSSHHND